MKKVLKKHQKTVKKLVVKHPNDILAANIRPLILDLSSLSTVRKAAAEINAIEGPLHVR
jgi:hypothetical protein